MEGRAAATARDQNYARVIVARRSRSRVDESLATSALRASRGGLPASLNQPMRATSPSRAQVPDTTPPATTTGEIQPLCRLTVARRARGVTWPSSVPGPSTPLVEAG